MRNHLQIHNERGIITIDDEDDKRGKINQQEGD